MVKCKMVHEMIRVSDLERSLKFYDEALNIYISFINNILNKYNIIYKTKDINEEEINKTYLNSGFNKVLTKI